MSNRKSHSAHERDLERAIGMIQYVNAHRSSVNHETLPILKKMAQASRGQNGMKKLIALSKELAPLLPPEASLPSRRRGMFPDSSSQDYPETRKKELNHCMSTLRVIMKETQLAVTPAGRK